MQVRVTGGIQQLLPGFLVPLFGQTVPLDKLVVDNERHILYSLAANSALQVRMTPVLISSAGVKQDHNQQQSASRSQQRQLIEAHGTAAITAIIPSLF